MSRFKCCFIIIQLYIFFSCLISADLIDSKLDLSTEKELHKYLSAVINVVDFCAEYKDQVDINLAFGLFMTNVNLIHTLRKKWRTIPKNVKNKIKNTIDENNEILNVFILKQSSDKDGSKTQRRILTLFNNASYWVESMEKFVYTMEKQFTPDRSREKYSPFSLYQKNVGNIYKWFPNPVESDTCLASLSKNPTNMKSSPLPCSISDFCYDMLKRGTNFGYSLTHRIVFLLMARFGRGCTVHSEQTDRVLLKRFCSTAHAEAAYIAENYYGLVDLFMEISLKGRILEFRCGVITELPEVLFKFWITQPCTLRKRTIKVAEVLSLALCAFDGQSQFLRRIWLDSILKFQTPDGCYGDVPVKKMNLTGRSLFTMESGKHNIIQHDGCNPHTTGLAAATFSAAVRFIIEEYY